MTFVPTSQNTLAKLCNFDRSGDVDRMGINLNPAALHGTVSEKLFCVKRLGRKPTQLDKVNE